MSTQAEFVKNVQQRFNGLQSRFGTFNKDARQAFERVRDGQYKPRIEGFSKRVKEVRGKVDSASREQAVVVAGNLRKVATRIEELARKPESSSASGVH